MADLVLHLKTKYFREIKTGTKREEYRRCNPYWARRLANRRYDRVVIWDAYKPKSEATVMLFPYRGYDIRTITHEHFGKEPVKVFAIPVGVMETTLQCEGCNLDYPEEILCPVATKEGTRRLCGICALEAINKTHGIERAQFPPGSTAEHYRLEAIRIRQRNVGGVDGGEKS